MTAPEPKKKKVRGKLHINREACKGCGFCVAFCPADALALSNEFNEKGYHPPYVVEETACTACGLCGMYCPDFAIYATKVTEDIIATADDEDDPHFSEKHKIEP